MASLLDVLPTELLLHVLTFLRHDDLTVVACLSRQFQAVVEPILWTKIELHSPSFHERCVHSQLKEEEEALQRPYHQYISEWPNNNSWALAYGCHKKDQNYHNKVQKFLKVLRNDHEGDQMRIDDLAGRVRWLCLPVSGAYLGEESDPWNALAILKNLEYLEISAFWKPLDEVVPFAGSSHTLLRLSTLKLRGYVPAEFVGYLLRSASTITNLEMGLLDVPIGQMERGYSPPPLSPTLTKSDGDEEIADPDASDVQAVEGARASSLDEETSPDGQAIAPRSLACLELSTISRFTLLTRLYLCRPSQVKDQTEVMSLSDDLFTSIRADKAILHEWASLLYAVKKTLIHLTLDQRPVGHELEPDITSNNEFMLFFAHGPGHQRFVEYVLPVLLKDGEWPALKSIQLFGFKCDEEEIEDGCDNVHSGQVADIDKQLQRRFPEVLVSSALGRRIIFSNNTGEIEGGGDVLDTSNSFSDDESEETERP